MSLWMSASTWHCSMFGIVSLIKGQVKAFRKCFFYPFSSFRSLHFQGFQEKRVVEKNVCFKNRAFSRREITWLTTLFFLYRQITSTIFSFRFLIVIPNICYFEFYGLFRWSQVCGSNLFVSIKLHGYSTDKNRFRFHSFLHKFLIHTELH